MGGVRTIRRIREDAGHYPPTKACELKCVRMTVSNLYSLTSPTDCSKDVHCRPFLSMYFRAAILAVLVLFSEDPDILKELVDLEKDLGGSRVEVEPLACVRRSV